MRTWRHLATTGCMLAALAQGPARAADTPAPVVRYSNDALTVRLTHASVTEVLDEIGRQTGAEIRGQVAEVREISADFEAVPLPEAIHRLLGTQNFALVYGEKGNLKALELIGEASTSGPVTPARPPVPSTAPAQSPEAIVLAWLARPVPLPAGSRLVHIFATPMANLRQVLEIGLRNDDPSVRADAVRTALQSAETQPEVRMALAQTIGDMDEANLSNMLRGTAGEHAEEIAGLVAAQTKIAPLRLKANAVLEAIGGDH